MTGIGYGTKSTSLEICKKNKIKMMKNEFKFRISDEEQEHINKLKDEFSIERYCRKLYRKYLFKDG